MKTTNIVNDLIVQFYTNLNKLLVPYAILNARISKEIIVSYDLSLINEPLSDIINAVSFSSPIPEHIPYTEKLVDFFNEMRKINQFFGYFLKDDFSFLLNVLMMGTYDSICDWIVCHIEDPKNIDMIFNQMYEDKISSIELRHKHSSLLDYLSHDIYDFPMKWINPKPFITNRLSAEIFMALNTIFKMSTYDMSNYVYWPVIQEKYSDPNSKELQQKLIENFTLNKG